MVLPITVTWSYRRIIDPTEKPFLSRYRIQTSYRPAHLESALYLGHALKVRLKQSILDETYNHRTGVERTNDAVKDCGLGHVRTPGRVHARTEVFVALCLRIVLAITNSTTSEETIQVVRNSSYELDSMTRSDRSDGGVALPVTLSCRRGYKPANIPTQRCGAAGSRSKDLRSFVITRERCALERPRRKRRGGGHWFVSVQRHSCPYRDRPTMKA